LKGSVLTSCAADPKTTAAIDRASAKLRTAIAKNCGGSDKDCATAGDDDDVTAPPISWPAACPDFEGTGCSNPIQNCNDVADCLVCINEKAVDQAVDLYYGALQANQSGSIL